MAVPDVHPKEERGICASLENQTVSGREHEDLPEKYSGGRAVPAAVSELRSKSDSGKPARSIPASAEPLLLGGRESKPDTVA